MVNKIGVCVLLREIEMYPEETLELSKEEREYLANLVENDIFRDNRDKMVKTLFIKEDHSQIGPQSP